VQCEQKLRSIPQDTAQHNRQQQVTFCQGCWRFTDFQHNKGTIAALELMTKPKTNTCRTASGLQGRLRVELTSHEIAKYVDYCIIPYQLLNYIINERLKQIVEMANVLEAGQEGGWQGRSVNINIKNMQFVKHEAHGQGK